VLWRTPILVLFVLIAASGCVTVSSTSTTDPINRTIFLVEAHGLFENAGFPISDDALLSLVEDGCLIADADFEEYIRGVRAGDPPPAFKEVFEVVARWARTDYC
jgi:hypothetical protein